MCNRRTQEDEFRQLLTRCSERGAGRAVFCLIHGDEGECHESLVERLAYTAEVTVSKAHGEGERPVRIAKIPWQYEGPVEVRLGRLIAWLLEQAMMQPYIGSRSTLGAFLASTSAGFVFVQHDIRAARWDYQTKSVIQAYRAHLARITADPSGPLLVVCLNVIYPCVTAGRWLLSRPRVLASRLVKARIRRDLARIAGIGIGADVATCPCLLLDELKPITRDDVLEWFSLHNILETEEQRLKTAASIFTGHGSMSLRKSMAEIETHLRNVQHAFLLERGLL
jgi:hypothetical protein